MAQGPTYTDLSDMHRDMCRVAGEQAAEIERLRAALWQIADNEYAGYGGIGGIARAALRTLKE